MNPCFYANEHCKGAFTWTGGNCYCAHHTHVPTCEHGQPLPELLGGGYLTACFCPR